MDNLLHKTLTTIAVTIAGFTLPINSAGAWTLWNEDIQGDLSNDGFAPTNLGSIKTGTNYLKASVNSGTINPDYFTLTVPKGLALQQIVLKSWTPLDEDIAFFAIQEGNIFDFVIPSDRGSANGLLGWTHLRIAQIGKDILPEIAASNLPPSESGFELPAPWVPGAIGFDVPLTEGTYSFWWRQGTDILVTAEFEFNAVTIPEPLTIMATGTAIGFGAFFKRQIGKKQSKDKPNA